MIFTLFGCDFDTPTKNETVKIIELKQKDCSTVYIKKVIWGMTNDNYCTYISKNKSLKDTVNEPYFRSMSFFYKLDEKCDLKVYNADELKGINRSDSSVHIIELQSKDVNFSNYKQLGLKSILWD